MTAPLHGTRPRMSWSGFVAVPKGTKAPVVTSSFGSSVRGLGVVTLWPRTMMSRQGMSWNPGSRCIHPMSALSGPTRPEFVAVPTPK